MYISINKDYFEKNKDRFEEEANSEFDSEEKYYLISDAPDEKVTIDSFDFDTGELSIVSDSYLGYISLDVRLTTEDIVNITQFAIKQLNKLKTVLEGLK